MRTVTAAVAVGGVVAALPLLLVGIASAATPPPAPTTPTYICDNVFAVQPAVYGYTNCQAFGGMPTSAYFTHNESYTLIPRTAGANDDPASDNGKIQKYRCSGGNVDLPTAVAPERCTELGAAIPSSQAPAPVPFTLPPPAPSS